MWDPVLLIAQIVSLQSLHYLTLSLVLPPLLYTFTDSRAVAYTHGGSATVGMVMDWREMAGVPALTPPSRTLAETSVSTFWSWMPSTDAFPFIGHGELDAHVDPVSSREDDVYSGDLLGGWRQSMSDFPDVRRRAIQHRDDEVSPEEAAHLAKLAKPSIRDPVRSWMISLAWLLASSVDIYIIYSLIRRPTLVLDFALTLILNHTILTTYYAASFPTSLFFWLVMSAGSMLIIIVAEQLCVRREMSEGLKAITTSTSQRRAATQLDREREELFDAAELDDDDDDLDPDLGEDNGRGQENIELMERGQSRTPGAG